MMQHCAGKIASWLHIQKTFKNKDLRGSTPLLLLTHPLSLCSCCVYNLLKCSGSANPLPEATGIIPTHPPTSLLPTVPEPPTILPAFSITNSRLRLAEVNLKKKFLNNDELPCSGAGLQETS